MISDAVSDDVAEVLTDTEIENHSPTASKRSVISNCACLPGYALMET